MDDIFCIINRHLITYFWTKIPKTSILILFLSSETPTTDDATGDLIQDEELERGAVSYRMFFYLFKSMGHPITIAYIVCRLLLEGCNVYRIFWLAFWSGSAVTVNPVSEGKRIKKDWEPVKPVKWVYLRFLRVFYIICHSQYNLYGIG